MMENRIELLASVMALSKLGVAAAMINTSLTGRSLAHCISITGSSICLFGEERLAAIDEVRGGLELDDGAYLFVPDSGDVAAPEWSRDLSQLAQEASDSNLPETAEVTLGHGAEYLYLRNHRPAQVGSGEQPALADLRGPVSPAWIAL